MKYYELNAMTVEERTIDAENHWSMYDENFSEYAAGCAKMSHDEYIADYIERTARAAEALRALVESVNCFDAFFSQVEARIGSGEDVQEIVRDFDKLHNEIRRKAHFGEIDYTLPEVDTAARYVRKLIAAIAKGKLSPSAADDSTAPASIASSRSNSSADAFAAAAIASADANAFEQHMAAHDDDGVVYPRQDARTHGSRIPYRRNKKMKITFTRESIAAHLADVQSMEHDTQDTCTYYLHMTDEQKMVSSYDRANVTFKADRDFTPYMEDEDFSRFYDDETLKNEGFAETVDSLYEKAVSYFEGLED